MINTNGVHKFLERQFIAQKYKEEKNKKLEKPRVNKWKPQVTVPVGFNFDKPLVYIEDSSLFIYIEDGE